MESPAIALGADLGRYREPGRNRCNRTCGESDGEADILQPSCQLAGSAQRIDPIKEATASFPIDIAFANDLPHDLENPVRDGYESFLVAAAMSDAEVKGLKERVVPA